MSDLIEVRISRLERLMYLMIGLQVPDLLPLIGILWFTTQATTSSALLRGISPVIFVPGSTSNTNESFHFVPLRSLEHLPHRTQEGLPWVNFLPQSWHKTTPGFSGSRRFILLHLAWNEYYNRRTCNSDLYIHPWSNPLDNILRKPCKAPRT